MASHEPYYVPAQSKWPIIASTGLLATVCALGTWFNDLTAGHEESHGPWICIVGGLITGYMLVGWFGTVRGDTRSALYSAHLDRSFRRALRCFV
ncbi:cytochrome c oxidase subunit 3, partial [Pseudomonas aeruginosa]